MFVCALRQTGDVYRVYPACHPVVAGIDNPVRISGRGWMDGAFSQVKQFKKNVFHVLL